KGKSPTPSMFPEPPPAPPRDAGRRPGQRVGGRRWHELKEFVVGAGNRVAFAAAQSVVEEPGQGANPLVIHGPVGTGKTHLLEGIFAGLRRKGGENRPVYVTAEEFTTKFVQAARLGKMSSFRRQFRECSALLLDNLNFLAN